MCCVTVHIAPAMENVTVLREAIHVNVTDSILEMFVSTKVPPSAVLFVWERNVIKVFIVV